MPKPKPSRLAQLAAELTRETAEEARRPDWTHDARKHFEKAATYSLAALVAIRKAETGATADATGGPQR